MLEIKAKSRRFDGKLFRVKTTCFKYSEAKKQASELREQGYLARIVKRNLPNGFNGKRHKVTYVVYYRRSK